MGKPRQSQDVTLAASTEDMLPAEGHGCVTASSPHHGTQPQAWVRSHLRSRLHGRRELPASCSALHLAASPPAIRLPEESAGAGLRTTVILCFSRCAGDSTRRLQSSRRPCPALPGQEHAPQCRQEPWLWTLTRSARTWPPLGRVVPGLTQPEELIAPRPGRGSTELLHFLMRIYLKKKKFYLLNFFKFLLGTLYF